MSERLARRLVIRGRVQGVWFRESMRIEAQRLGVAGWVRNRPDGTVEAVVAGPAEALDALIAWARRGPEAAEVQRVEVEEADGKFEGFEKRATG
jgi:acylphosphatase